MGKHFIINTVHLNYRFDLGVIGYIKSFFYLHVLLIGKFLMINTTDVISVSLN